MTRVANVAVLLAVLCAGRLAAAKSYSGAKVATLAPVELPLADDDIDCSSKADGFYPDPTDACSDLFYACSGGHSHEMECAEATVFDVESGQCMQREFVAACGGEATTTTEAPLRMSEAPPFEFDCASRADGDYEADSCSQAYVSCSGGQPVFRSCGDGLRFDSASGMCLESDFVAACGGSATELPETTTVASDPSFDCADRPDGFYSNPGDQCSPMFFACSGGFARAMQCAEGMLWDEADGRCMEKEFIAACGGVATTTEAFVAADEIPPAFAIDCSSLADGDYANADEACSAKFASCVGGSAIFRECVAGTVFDTDSNACLEQEFVAACGGSATTAPETTTVASDPSFNCAAEVDGFYPDPTEPCSSVFFACIGGFTRAMTCAESLVFDALTGLCMERDFVVACGGQATTIAPFEPAVSDPPPFEFDCSARDDGDFANPAESCSSLYVSCSGSAPVYRQCAGDLKFDEISTECHEAEWVVACGGQSTTRAPETKRPRRVKGGKKAMKTTTAAGITEEEELADEETTTVSSYTPKSRKYRAAAGYGSKATTTLASATADEDYGYGEEEELDEVPTTTTARPSTTTTARPVTKPYAKPTTTLAAEPETTTITTVKQTTSSYGKRTTTLAEPETTTTAKPTTSSYGKRTTTLAEPETTTTTAKPTTKAYGKRTTTLAEPTTKAPITRGYRTTGKPTTTAAEPEEEVDVCESVTAPGFYDDPSHCQKFVFCCEDQPTVKLTCPSDSVFNPLKKKCEDPKDVAGSCGAFPSVPTFDCAGKKPGYYRDPFKCDTYYYCKRASGQAFKYECEDGAAFDNIAKECRPEASVAGCLPERDAEMQSFCSQKNVTGLQPHPDVCGEGIICLNSYAFRFACEGEQKLDSFTGKCASIHQVEAQCKKASRR